MAEKYEFPDDLRLIADQPIKDDGLGKLPDANKGSAIEKERDQPCWNWRVDELSFMRALIAYCRHGNRLSDNGGRYDYLHLWPEDLPWQGSLWSENCDCNFTMLVDRDWQVVWPKEVEKLEVRETKFAIDRNGYVTKLPTEHAI